LVDVFRKIDQITEYNKLVLALSQDLVDLANAKMTQVVAQAGIDELTVPELQLVGIFV
jgi:hypothetical protein